MRPPPGFEALERLLPRTSQREAVATIRGFDWQRWLTVRSWLDLAEGDSLWVEWAEDLSILGADGAAKTIQARDQQRPCTLNHRPILDVISRAFERPHFAETLIWMTAAIGTERGNPLGQPGIGLWMALTKTARPVDELRAYLAQPGRLSEAAREQVMTGTKNDFRTLLKRVKWVVGAPQIDDLRVEVEGEVLGRLERLGVKEPHLLTASTSLLLFDHVGRASVRRNAHDRRLTLSELTDLILHHNVQMNARARAIAPGGTPPPFRARPTPERTIPMSAAWFVYTEQSIPMIGREAELEKLQSFANDSTPFAWWVVGGPGGIGKSRLAQTFLSTLSEDWQHGFVEAGKLPEFESYLAATAEDAFIVVDYASMSADKIGRMIAECAGIAKVGRRLRILLLDRDVGASAEWLQRLAEPFTSRASAVNGTRFDTPLELPPLHGRERELVSAWLDAAELDSKKLIPPRSSHAWKQVRRLTGGRPLFLGLAAAAFASGSQRIESPEDLLNALLRREILRWIDKLGDKEVLTDHLDALATSTAAWGLPIPWVDNLSNWYVYAATEEAKQRYFPEKFHDRLTSYAELLSEPQTRKMAQDLIEEWVRDVASVMRPSITTAQFTDLLWRLHDLTGGGLRIEPDIFGEYFLSQYWDPSAKTTARRLLPPASDEEISRQIWSAWQFQPLAVVFSLSQLREHDWAEKSVVRAFKQLTPAIASSGSSPLRAVEAFASVLHDCAIRIGTIMLPQPYTGELVSLLKTLHEAHPSSPHIAYLYWRRLKASLTFEPESKWAAIINELFCLIDAVIQSSGREDLNLHIADVLELQARYNPSTIQSFPKWLALIDHLQETFPASEEFDLLTAQIYFVLTGAGSTVEMREKHADLSALWIAIDERLRTLVLRTSNTSYNFAIVAAETSGNLSVEYRLRSDLPPIKKLFKLVTSIWQNHQTDDRYDRVRIQLLCNMLRTSVQAKCSSQILWALAETSRLIGKTSPTEFQLELIEMHFSAIGYGVGERSSKVTCAALTSLFSKEWDRRDEWIRKRLFDGLYRLEFTIGLTEDDAFMKSVGKVIEQLMREKVAGEIVKGGLDEFGMPHSNRRDSEALLSAILRYVSLVGLSAPGQLKIAQLLAYYFWRFGEHPPPSVCHGFPFELHRQSSGVDVVVLESAYLGMPFIHQIEFPSLTDASPQLKTK